MKDRLHVAVGLVFNAKGEILIAKRPPQKYLPGLWEFPGGKVELGESAQQALYRELQEEIGIIVQSCQALMQTEHAYPDRIVLLDVWRIEQFSGEPQGIEGQELRWVAPSSLPNYEFPQANHPVVESLISIK